ncbi:MAG TPA: TPM domain-containing protein [Cyclobacteriaceae bacterium]|nr:TPM domain-containing protein [Cyclobacteriaceae bacterium]
MKRFLIFILLLCLSPLADAQKKIPELWGHRVHDEANVLSSAAVDNLERRLKIFEDSTTNQLAVLIVSSLEGEPIETYSIKVVEAWKLGTEKNDNGVLLLVSIGDRKVRIEVGQGLEGVLTDALSNRIIRNEIAPNFRRGDYEGGIVAAVDAIIKATKGEYKADNITSRRKGGRGGIGLFAVIIFVVLGVFTWTALFAKGCAGWGTYGVLTPFYFVLPGVALGNYTTGAYVFFAYLIGFPILKLILARTAWGQGIAQQMEQSSRNRGGGWSSGGGWFLGGGNWGGGGGGWGGGGGFSGGGGSFGGGGSSGSW